MKTLIGIPLLIFGVGWTAILGLIYWVVSGVPEANSFFPMYMFAIGPLALIVGLAFIVMGRADARKARQEVDHIVKDGVDATGTVTCVDNNYNILVGDAPIYSIVEFTFRDAAGNEHTTRKEDVNRELVIRNKIQVGSQVQLKYIPTNPEENGLLLLDARAAAQAAAQSAAN